jgi:lipopolysaccharide transport system permease protein
LAVLGLFIREARQVVPFALTLILYLTPILYMPDQLPPALRSWSALNPLADVMVLLHAAVQGQSWTWDNLLRPLTLWLLLTPTAWLLFKKTELHMREAL